MVSRVKQIAQKVNDKGGIFMFLRAQFSSQVSSLTDFGVTFFLVNAFGILYAYSTFIGSVSGGVVNSIVNYKWTFKAQGVKKKHVAIKYLMVWVGSILFNTSGTIVLTELIRNIDFLNVHLGANLFLVPKIVVSLIVGFVWNYNMQRLFVYRDRDVKGFFKKLRTGERSSIEKEKYTIGDKKNDE